MGFYSSWVEVRMPLCRAVFALFLWINAIIGPAHGKVRYFLYGPWWYTVVCALYMTAASRRWHFQRTLAATAKIYSPFIQFVYWAGVYPAHHPWGDPTESYLTIAMVLTSVVLFLETIVPMNTHYATHRQTNANFPVIPSFALNSIVYVLYMFTFLLLSSKDDPVYSGLGFTSDRRRDAMLAFVGWLILMAWNTVVVVFTWWRKNAEWMYGHSKLGQEDDGTGEIPGVYEMDTNDSV